MEDCKLFLKCLFYSDVDDNLWHLIRSNTRIVRVRFLVRSEEIVGKSIRKKMVLGGIHKTSIKKGIYVKNVKDIQFVQFVE